jgi:hypothetical protein
MLRKLPLCIFNNICFERDLRAKLSGDLGMLLNGKARTDLVTVNLPEGWGTLLLKTLPMIPLSLPSQSFTGVGLKITPISLLGVT